MNEFSLITCPHCGTAKLGADAAQMLAVFYDCSGCGARLKPNSATAASSAPTAPSHAHRFRRPASTSSGALLLRRSLMMRWHALDGRDWAKAVAVGIGVSVLTALFMLAGLKSGISPLPKPLGLAFAETVLRSELPLPVGLLFHTVWVTAFSVLYVVLFRDRLTFMPALMLAVALWLLVLVFFFPVVGWGFLGLAVGPKLIIGAAVPHLLFAVFLWLLCKWVFEGSRQQSEKYLTEFEGSAEETMAEQQSKSALRDTWESAAPGWVKWEHVFAEALKDATHTLIEMAGINSGARVLDVACGGGSQTIEVAKRVGPKGLVIANDISAAMLDHVRQRAAREGIKNIETVECAAEDLKEAQAPFDASLCRLGLMLFPSPASALRAIHRVLKPGARFAALVFTTPATNPFMALADAHPAAPCGETSLRLPDNRGFSLWAAKAS